MPPRATDATGWLVLVDFDGTLTARDADLVIADQVLAGDPGRAAALAALVDAYERTELGARAYLEGYLALLGLSAEELTARAARVPTRPGAHELFAACARAGARALVLSEGLDLWVRPALAAAGLGDLPVSCNRARPRGAAWSVLPAEDGEPCARCLSCKAPHVRRAHASGLRVALVGNGASDLCAARVADRVFACGGLRGHCEREGLAHTPWTELTEVAAALDLL